MSVKDQLEQHHVDGDHTTVKSKRSTNTGVVSEFNKEAAWQAQQYGGYAGEDLCCVSPLRRSLCVFSVCCILEYRGSALRLLL